MTYVVDCRRCPRGRGARRSGDGRGLEKYFARRAGGVERFDFQHPEVRGLGGEEGGDGGEIGMRFHDLAAELKVSDAVGGLVVGEASQGGGARSGERGAGSRGRPRGGDRGEELGNGRRGGGAGLSFGATVGGKRGSGEGIGAAEQARDLRLRRVDTQEELLALEEEFVDADLPV